MKIRFIPFAQLLVAFGLIIAIDTLMPNVKLEGSWILPLSAALSVAGVMLVIISGKEFIRFKTTVNPINPENTTSLVTSGSYKFSRNPMYLGFVFILVGLVAFLGNVLSLLVVALFIWYNTKYQILPEEKALENKFGASFREYKKKVRRWI